MKSAIDKEYEGSPLTADEDRRIILGSEILLLLKWHRKMNSANRSWHTWMRPWTIQTNALFSISARGTEIATDLNSGSGNATAQTLRRSF
jgi:hypothetical protein